MIGYNWNNSLIMLQVIPKLYNIKGLKSITSYNHYFNYQHLFLGLAAINCGYSST